MIGVRSSRLYEICGLDLQHVPRIFILAYRLPLALAVPIQLYARQLAFGAEGNV